MLYFISLSLIVTLNCCIQKSILSKILWYSGGLDDLVIYEQIKQT